MRTTPPFFKETFKTEISNLQIVSPGPDVLFLFYIFEKRYPRVCRPEKEATNQLWRTLKYREINSSPIVRNFTHGSGRPLRHWNFELTYSRKSKMKLNQLGKTRARKRREYL